MSFYDFIASVFLGKTLLILIASYVHVTMQGQGLPPYHQSTIDPWNPLRTKMDSGDSILTRFAPPKGFVRTPVDSLSFAAYLRNLPLKPKGSAVKLYNGMPKSNPVHEAVVDLPIGKRNLHQCADAIIRLRAEYLYQQGRFKDIHFNFTNGFKAEYQKWREGNRIVVEGNRAYWQKKTTSATSQSHFWKYLETVFSYAGTASLSQELTSITLENIQIGDIFIQGGFPGHAVLVVDMARHRETGQKAILLAQSYMPAQETHILKNPNNTGLSPWYLVQDVQPMLITPEWVFGETDVKRFPN